jgi:Ca-activated chloride channel family protein
VENAAVPSPRSRRLTTRVRALIIGALVMAATGCSFSLDTNGSGPASTGGGPAEIPSGRIPVELVVSPEKVTLLTELAEQFNNDRDLSTVEVPGGEKARAFVRVSRKASGGAAALLIDDWNDEATDGPRPTVWSPAAASWGAVVTQRRSEQGKADIIGSSRAFMRTPLVIAMPRPMAQALGWPTTPIGWTDILALAKEPTGWASKGHPEWGRFRLGKTNPNLSTSGLSATIAQYYAAAGSGQRLGLEDLRNPAVLQFARDLESSVVHYGDTTLTFLNNWARADQRGNALAYASAAAVEEKSVIDYNAGNPDGVLSPGETARPPRLPLVAIYPKEGTLFSDNPFIVLDAPWVTEPQKAAAARFEEYVQLPANQEKVLQFGFRPGNPDVAIAAPIVAANGVDPDQPTKTLEVPEPKVITGVLDAWALTRKGARVLLVLDVSGSMGEEAVPGGSDSKLDLAKRAAASALEQFKPDDLVGLRIFSSQIGPNLEDVIDLVAIGPIGAARESMRSRIASLVPTNGTPLYTATLQSFREMQEALDPARINAIVLLTDGRNEDTNDDLRGLLSELRSGTEGQLVSPVRIFPIAYGADADLDTLKRIAEATDAAAYNAKDPRTIEKVFADVIGNF